MESDFESQYYKDYEDREKWWRSTIKNTPIPGTYNCNDFIHELNAVPISKTYGFKSSGRTKNADPSKTGEYLLPGLYKHKDFVSENVSKPATYNFKSTDRSKSAGGMCGTVSKDALRSEVSPTTYDRGFVPVEKLRVSHSVFRSQSQRFPTIHFRPKKGPAPGQYEVRKESEEKRAWSAPFNSTSPRFLKVHKLNTPGPGAYTKMYQLPMPPHIKYIGRYHGLFFPPGVS